MTKTQQDRLREAKEKKNRNLSKQNQIIERRKTIKRADKWDKNVTVLIQIGEKQKKEVYIDHKNEIKKRFKKMKNRKILFGTILLLFALIGICSIPNVSADTVKIPPLSYVYYRTNTLEYRDEINLYVSSSGTINIYIMDAEGFSKFQDSLGIVFEYWKRWKDATYVDYIFSIPENGIYYVVLLNKNLLFSRTANVQITVDYYYEPSVEPDNYLLGLLVVFITVVIFGVAIALVVRNYKRKNLREDIKLEKVSKTQEKQIPKITYCRECGTEIADESKMFCPMCGKEQ